MGHFLATFGLLITVHFSSSKADDCKWDFVIFTQQWLPTYCSRPSFDVYNIEHCSIDRKITTWTVHGLWPSSKRPPQPSKCTNATFDETQIEKLEDKLDQFWPNVFPDTAHIDFWKHEWEKHGTCALCLESLKGEYSYFNTSLSFNSKYNISWILETAKILPDTNIQYKFSAIKDAIAQHFNTEVNILCIVEKEKKFQYLAEVEVCLDKQLQLHSCEKSSAYYSHGRPLRKELAISCADHDQYPVIYLPFSYPTQV